MLSGQNDSEPLARPLTPYEMDRIWRKLIDHGRRVPFVEVGRIVAGLSERCNRSASKMGSSAGKAAEIPLLTQGSYIPGASRS